MSSDAAVGPVISVRKVSKAYRLWTTPSARLVTPALLALARLLPARLRRRLETHAVRGYRDFFALSDVSFDVGKGECLGVIGRNGAGKSTLLQLITGTLQPTDGTIEVRGRVAALLELGSGFNPDFTGRENVFLNASILGLTREQIEERYDEILRFAEIGDFIDEPVKFYSSGMTVRLAFAVIAHVDADVLIIDEALSVGDARFQLKCARAIDRFVERGTTLLFVSHDTSTVKRLCQQALLVEQGRLLYRGIPNDVANLYSKLTADGGSVEAIQPDIRALQDRPTLPAPAPLTASASTGPISAEAPPDLRMAPAPAGSDLNALQLRIKAYDVLLRELPESSAVVERAEKLLTDERSHARVTGQEFSYGGEFGLIREIEVIDADGHPRTWFTSGEPVEVRLLLESFERLQDPIFALTIKNAAGVEVYGTNTLFARQPARPMEAGEKRLVAFTFNIDLMPGHYFLSCGFTHFFGEELSVIHRRYDAVKLDVHGKDLTFGIANLHARIAERALAAEARPGSTP